MTPSDQMSARSSTSLVERSCSGDMYLGVPMIASGRVIDELFICFGLRLSLAPPLPRDEDIEIFESPKSRTFTSGRWSTLFVKNMLAGFRSR
jgi:hypothetical protein